MKFVMLRMSRFVHASEYDLIIYICRSILYVYIVCVRERKRVSVRFVI